MLYALLFNPLGMPSFVATLTGLLAILGLQLYVLGAAGSSEKVRHAPSLHDDQPAALLLTISAGASTMAMAPRAMTHHVNVICNPDKQSIKTA